MGHNTHDGISEGPPVSFRSRLLLFFMIIVIVPMVAVALVLFSITADSETGKADAQVAQGLRAAFGVYDSKRGDARPQLARVARDPQLAHALERRDRAAIAARISTLAGSVPGVLRVWVYDANRRLLSDAGRADAVAAAVAAPSMASRRIGYVGVSITSGGAYVDEVRRVTGLHVRVAAGSRVVGSTVPGGTGLASGSVRLAGHEYRGRVALLDETFGAPVRVGVYEDGGKLGSAIAHRRLLIGAILGAFLLLALLSSVVVVRALQRQVETFLDAARRLAHGDFSRPVPVEGSDEFAQLGREFNTMSGQLAVKIEEVQRKRGELEETIRRVGEAFAAGLDRQEMVNIAVRTAVEACQADVGRALPLDIRRMKTARVGEETPELEAALETAERRAFEIHLEDSQDWLAMLDASGDADSDGDSAAERAVGRERRPMRVTQGGYFAMAVPLMARPALGRGVEQVGVVSIARSGRDFDEGEYDLFAYLAGQAAVSIENVDLHETVRRQALTDELTGLYNLRHFHDTLDAELERQRRFGTDVGLMMLDIDDFKRINDTYGHQQGDLVLIEVARELRAHSRDIDEPARYGGEEMAVILPQTDVAGAELLAERMRVAVEDLRIDRLDGEGQIQVTASFGVASLPHNANEKAALIAEADAALYRAKRAGKNRVARAEPVTAES
jgi:diguanylate cyclase (GGDEF)-like protein